MQIIKKVDNQVDLSSSLLFLILTLCKESENLRKYLSLSLLLLLLLLIVIAVVSGCSVIVIFSRSLVGAIIILLAVLVAFRSLSAILQAHVVIK